MESVPYTWFLKQQHVDENTPLWLPLSRKDQKNLEEALLAAEIGLGDVDAVPVNGGRSEVRIQDRCYVERYGVVPPPPLCPVRRVLWVRHEGGTDGTWQPYNEQVDEAIENAYKLLLESAGNSMDEQLQVSFFMREVQLEDGLGGVVHLELSQTPTDDGNLQWNLLAEERHQITHSPRQGGGPSWLQAFSGEKQPTNSIQRTPMKRGYGEVPLSDGYVEEELLSQDVYRLVVCVHGIAGEDIAPDVGRCLRQNLHRSQLQALGVEEDEDGNWGPEDQFPVTQQQPKNEVIEVFWHQDAKEAFDHSKDLAQRFDHMSLSSMPRVRELVNRATCNAILYSHHREEILDAVKRCVEAALDRFYACHTEFVGEVVLVGHSLGGMALFELLSEKKLECEVRAFYALGCPISLLSQADRPPLEESRFPGGTTRFFNVFHPLDPLACRSEPMLMPELESKPPAKIPTTRCYEAGLADAGYQRVQAFLGRFKKEKDGGEDNASDHGSVASSSAQTKDSILSPTTCAQRKREEQRAARLKELIELRLHGRLDWVLQSDIGSDAGSENLDVAAARASHFSYLRCFDLSAFIHSTCIQLVQPPEPDRPPQETVVDIFGRTVKKAGADAGSGLSSFWNRAKESKAADNLRKFGDSANEKYNNSGAAHVVKGTGQAVTGIFGTARAVYGTAKLIGGATSSAGNLVSKVRG